MRNRETRNYFLGYAFIFNAKWINAITITGEILPLKKEDEVKKKKSHVWFILLYKMKETNIEIIAWLVVYFPSFSFKINSESSTQASVTKNGNISNKPN